MKYYMAPMEGVTTYIYRRAYHTYYQPMDKYFIPFFVPHSQKKFTSREKNELNPEHNKGMKTIPQILTSNAKDFIRLARQIREIGYNEVNLNLGCPSKTVVSKGRGSGFLGEPDKLDRFLDTIYEELPDMKVSIKTRIGKDSKDEWEDLLKIYEKYPLEELIIHPRIQTDYYKNFARWDSMAYAQRYSRQTLCYNGDIFTQDDYQKWEENFINTNSNKESSTLPIDRIMLGRGLIANPGLIEQISGKEEKTDKNRLKKFHQMIYEGYRELLCGDRNVLFKMKELWSYMKVQFPEQKKLWKKIQKCERCDLYESLIEEVFDLET